MSKRRCNGEGSITLRKDGKGRYYSRKMVYDMDGEIQEKVKTNNKEQLLQ